MDCAVSAYAYHLLIAGRANPTLLAGTGNSDARHTDKLLSAGSAAITAFLTVKVVINISPISMHRFTAAFADKHTTACHTIARYIGAKSDPTKVLWELNWYQQDIRDQQTKIRRYKRDTVVLNKMSSVPQTPANLKRWADKHIMPHYLFYDYNNGRVKTQVYCTYCEKFSVIKRPKNNDVLRCPKCDQKVIAKAQGRRAAYYEDRETCQVVQQISPHELVVRIYKLYWSYVKGKDTTRKSAYEVMRMR